LKNIKTTLSHGDDVARAIGELVGNEKAIGEVVHIAGASAVTWEQVLNIYCNALEPIIGRAKVVYEDHVEKISNPLGKNYQVKYARAINREFDNSKLFSIIGNMDFISAENGLTNCVRRFVEGPRRFKTISWKNEALLDRISHERTPLKSFKKAKWKAFYLVARYTPYFLFKRNWL
jgi:nucleoside-diphosphate-sugar epimerase